MKRWAQAATLVTQHTPSTSELTTAGRLDFLQGPVLNCLLDALRVLNDRMAFR